MATLRKWQPVQQRRPSKSAFSIERILIICAAVAVGITVFMMLQPDKPAQSVILPGSPEAVRAEAEHNRARAEATRIEQAERERQQAIIREQQRRQQADMFNQRYNTDRTPVGSVGGETPAAPAPQGFSVVKPALPPGQSGGGFREVKWPKQGQ